MLMIVPAGVVLQPVDALQEHLFRVLVRNVADHDGRPAVFATQQPLKVDFELWAGRVVGVLA